MASEATGIVNQLRLVEQLMEARWKKIHELNCRREDSKRKVLEATASYETMKGKLREDEELCKQILVDVTLQVINQYSKIFKTQVPTRQQQTSANRSPDLRLGSGSLFFPVGLARGGVTGVLIPLTVGA